jgi:hypothetical protein
MEEVVAAMSDPPLMRVMRVMRVMIVLGAFHIALFGR